MKKQKGVLFMKHRDTRMRHFKRQNSKIFSPDGPCEDVFSGFAVALDVSGCYECP